MKVSPNYYDEIFNYKGEWDMPSLCGLKIRQVEGGTSVTYAGEKLAKQICEAKGLVLDECTYIECTPDTNSKLSFYDEEYFVVDFKADLQHRYRQLSLEEIKHILDHKVVER